MNQTTITIETTTVLMLKTRHINTVWCPSCRRNVPAIALAGRDLAALGTLPRDLHQSDAPDGSVLLCLKSLLTTIANGNIR